MNLVYDFLFFSPSDKFFIYRVRCPIFQTDSISAFNIDDIPQELKIQERLKSERCVSTFDVHSEKIDLGCQITTTIVEWKVPPCHGINSACYSIPKKLKNVCSIK